MDKPAPEVEDFDEMLPHVGSFGLFQKRVLCVSLPINYFLAVVCMAQVYQTMVPDHWCHVPELQHLPVDLRRNIAIPTVTSSRGGHQTEYAKCSVYDVNFTQVMDEQLGRGGLPAGNASWPVRSCAHGWEYDFRQGMYPTIVTEGDWVCDNDWRPNFAQAMFFAGAIVGSLAFGLVADAYGRLPVLVMANLLASAAGVATAFANTFATYVTCRFLVGLSYDMHYMMMYIILMEYVGPEKRTLVGNVPLAIFLTLGFVTLPWIAYGMADWRLFSIVTSAPLAVVLVAPWLVPESARWLVLRGRIERAVDTLRTVARVNGRYVSETVFHQFQVATHKAFLEESQRDHNWIYLFRTPIMRKRMFLMIVMWMVITLVYDGHLRSLYILPYNPFVTNSFAGLLELPADLTPLLTLESLGRRWTCFLALTLSGLSSIATGLIHPEFPLTIATMAMLGRFCITIAMNAGIQYTVELVPTQLRGQGVSVVHIMGHCATFFVPFILYLSTFGTTLPYMVLGGLSVLGGFMCLLLPETASENLPESVADAELFGQDQPFHHVPILAKRRRMDLATSNATHDNLAFDRNTTL